MERPDGQNGERQRLEELRRLGLRPVGDEPLFAPYVELVRRMFNVPIAGVSMVDKTDEWMVACVGTDRRRGPRSESFCTHGVLGTGVYVVEDAGVEPTFAHNPQVRADGIRFYAGVPIVPTAGRPVGMLCMKDRVPRTFSAEDRARLELVGEAVSRVLDSRLAARRLIESEGLLASMFRASGLGFSVWSPTGGAGAPDLVLVRMNASAGVLASEGSDRSVGRSLREVFPWAEENGVCDLALACLGEASGHLIEARLPDDRVVQVRCSRIPGPLVLVTMDDVTDERRQAAALAEREEQLRLFVEHAPAAVAMLDASMRYVACSRRWLEEYGLGDAELRGRSHYEVFPDITEEWRAIHARCLQGEVLSCAEEPWRRASGRVEWIRWEIRPWRGACGTIGGMMMFTEVITERKLASDRLRLAVEAADAANRARSQFLSHMSHELRTPLTAILGYAEILTREQNLDTGPREQAAAIAQNGKHLLALLDDILDTSKLDAGEMGIETRVVDLRQVIEGVLSMFTPTAREKGITLEVVCRGGVPASLLSDATRLRQILVNLVGNAVKFTAHGSVRLVVSATRPVDGIARLRFDVIDTGLGIAPEFRGQLFQRFAQQDPSMTRRFGGTGLGLVICRGLARRLGGEVWLEASEPGRGSDFAVMLPVRVASDGVLGEFGSAPAPEAPDAAPRADLVGRVLLAEDSPDSQRLLRFMLERSGLEVEVATDGQQAVDRALAAWRDGRGFDLILMDMQMPTMDGYAATREIRRAGVPTPVIALTAHAMAGDRRACLEAGCDDYATKPIDHQTLCSLCRAWIGSDRRARAA